MEETKEDLILRWEHEEYEISCDWIESQDISDEEKEKLYDALWEAHQNKPK